MRLIGWIAMALFLAGCGGAPDSAPAGAGYRLVGFTESLQPGAARLFGLTEACQAEFPGSRICSSVEVLQTTAIPRGLEGDAWVQPSFVASIDRSLVDASGLVVLGGPPSNCDQWKGTASTGIVVDAEGTFHSGARARCTDPHPVACCAPARE